MRTNGSLSHWSRGSHVDGVDVAVEQDAATAAGAAEDGGELRPAGEVEAGRHEPVAFAGRLRLPHVRLGAERLEPRGEQPLQLLLVARGVAGKARGGVARDELGREADELVLRVPYRLDDALLERRLQLHPGPPSVDGHLRRRRAYNGGAGATPRFYDAADDQEGAWAI